MKNYYHFITLCLLLLPQKVIFDPADKPLFSHSSIPISIENNHYEYKGNKTDKICGAILDFTVTSGENKTVTSGSVGSCTNISSCITYTGGASGNTVRVTFIELPSGGGSNVKWSRTLTAPWTSCFGSPACNCGGNPPVFSVQANAQVRVDVSNNNGVAMSFQVND